MDARRLFHAVVVTGAALAACGGAADGPSTPSSGGDASTNAQADAPYAADAADASDALDAADDADAACPPGSDRPFPPCYLIK